MTIFYRRLPKFDYVRPPTIEQALSCLSPDFPVRHQVFAGGTDMLPKLKSREVAAPPRLIDLKGISGLDRITFDNRRGLTIGACAAIRDVARDAEVRRRYTALAEGAALIASNQLQHRGTIVGNVCNAVPSADSAPALLVHDTQVVCASARGERSVPLEDFFVDVGMTALLPGEIVTQLILPVPQAAERSTYLKLAPRGRMDLAVVGVAVALVLDRGVVRRARIALGSAAPVPLRAFEAEAALLDQRVDDGLIARVAAIAAEHTRTRTSHRASASYRRSMLEVLVRRALSRLAAPADQPALAVEP